MQVLRRRHLPELTLAQFPQCLGKGVCVADWQAEMTFGSLGHRSRKKSELQNQGRTQIPIRC